MKNRNILVLAIIAVSALLFTQCVTDEAAPVEEVVDAGLELYINEVYSTGDPDWVEIYNATSEDVDISGFGVSDGPTKKYDLPEGTIVPAKGYYVFMSDKTVTGFSLSSGGEEFYIWDKEGKLVDNVAFPALDDGVSYGRESDGADTWLNMAPTQGAANSTVNNPPTIIAAAIENVNDNEAFTYELVASDADGLSSVKLFYEVKDGDVGFIEMAPLGGGDYKIKLPMFNAGDEVSYYVVATDATGKKSYFPETAPDTKGSFTVADGLVIFNEVNLSTENPAEDEAIKVSVKAYDKSGVDEVKLYYLVNDDVADNKEDFKLTLNGDVWEGEIPGQANDAVIRYYLRAKDNEGNKSYYPVETKDADGNVTSDFDHDIATTWPSITVAPLVILDALVINEIEGAGDPDYIELYNGTSADIDISGYKLQDSDPADAYTIPEGTTLAAGGFYVLNCDKGDGVSSAAFKVSSSGEDITLTDASGNVVDQLLAVDWPAGHLGLVGRVQDAAEKWEIKTVETKGTTNN